MKTIAVSLLAGGLALAAILTQGSTIARSDEAMKARYRRPVLIPFPDSNPYTPEKAALGKALFFDPRLSGARNMTCASCHNPSFGWEVPVKTAVGAQNIHLSRQAPTILNTAWIKPFFWDGRAATAEEQAKGPIEAPAEMNMPLAEAVRRLDAVPGYQRWFRRVFPQTGITPDTIAAALATYERMVVSSYSPFDAWIDGNEAAISESAKRGFALFNGKAQCAGCHSGWNFTDNRFHDIGISSSDPGHARMVPGDPKAQFAFKTPGLRDIAQRAPFMHNGEFPTLETVVLHYVGGGIDRPSRSDLMRPIALDEREITDLVHFMETLTGPRHTVVLPVLPN